MTRALFHLPDFIVYSGLPMVRKLPDSERHSLDRLTFSFDGWAITLDGLLDANDYRAAAYSGGHLITHVGEVRRSGGEPFTTGQLREVLGWLGTCFSFARGRWSSPCLAVGFNGQEEVIWEEWGVPHIQPLGRESSWFPEDQASTAMDRLAEGLWRRWQDTEVRGSLELALAWYIEANTQDDVQARVAIAQMGLELTAWLLLVRDASVLSPRGFEKLEAHDVLRLTLGWTDGATDVPTLFGDLATFASGQQPAIDGPEAFTRIRNRIVHPPKGGGGAGSAPLDAVIDAGALGLWYLELTLLNLVGYVGPYRNRTVRGAVMSVPWDV